MRLALRGGRRMPVRRERMLERRAGRLGEAEGARLARQPDAASALPAAASQLRDQLLRHAEGLNLDRVRRLQRTDRNLAALEPEYESTQRARDRARLAYEEAKARLDAFRAVTPLEESQRGLTQGTRRLLRALLVVGDAAANHAACQVLGASELATLGLAMALTVVQLVLAESVGRTLKGAHRASLTEERGCGAGYEFTSQSRWMLISACVGGLALAWALTRMRVRALEILGTGDGGDVFAFVCIPLVFMLAAAWMEFAWHQPLADVHDRLTGIVELHERKWNRAAAAADAVEKRRDELAYQHQSETALAVSAHHQWLRLTESLIATMNAAALAAGAESHHLAERSDVLPGDRAAWVEDVVRHTRPQPISSVWDVTDPQTVAAPALLQLPRAAS